GGLQLILNRALTWLPLPTGEIGAVIRQSQPECRHLDTRGCNFPQMRWYIRASPIERATCLVFLILRPLPPVSAPWLILCAGWAMCRPSAFCFVRRLAWAMPVTYCAW